MQGAMFRSDLTVTTIDNTVMRAEYKLEDLGDWPRDDILRTSRVTGGIGIAMTQTSEKRHTMKYIKQRVGVAMNAPIWRPEAQRACQPRGARLARCGISTYQSDYIGFGE
jgi:hypothetical protein